MAFLVPLVFRRSRTAASARSRQMHAEQVESAFAQGGHGAIIRIKVVETPGDDVGENWSGCRRDFRSGSFHLAQKNEAESAPVPPALWPRRRARVAVLQPDAASGFLAGRLA